MLRHEFECPEREIIDVSVLDHVIAIALWMLALLIIDNGIVRRIPKLNSFKGRTYAIHALAISVVAYDSFPDVVTILMHPNCATTGAPRSYMAVQVCTAWHLYHPLLGMNPSDVFHHVVMAAPALCIGLTGSMSVLYNASIFFGCGLPLALSEWAQVLVQLGHITSLTQKRFKSQLYTCIRGPGVIAIGMLIYTSKDFGRAPSWIVCLMAVHTVFNGVYYNHLVNKHYIEQRVHAKFESQGHRLCSK